MALEASLYNPVETVRLHSFDFNALGVGYVAE